MTFQIRPISRTHNVRYMSLGDEAFQPLKNFLRKQAKTHHLRHISKTYIVCDSGAGNGRKIIAYLTLVCSEINSEVQNAVDHIPSIPYQTLPAIKLARMAIDRRFRGVGLGRSLMDWCIAHVLKTIVPFVGCRFLVVDSKQQSIGFYKQMGFTILDTPDNKAEQHPVMWIDLWKLQKEIDTLDSAGVHQQDLGI